MGSCCHPATSTASEVRSVEVEACDIYAIYNAIALGTRDLILLDMRSAEEHKENHIVGSINFDIADDRIAENKEEEIALKLSKFIKGKLIKTDRIYIMYGEHQN